MCNLDCFCVLIACNVAFKCGLWFIIAMMCLCVCVESLYVHALLTTALSFQWQESRPLELALLHLDWSPLHPSQSYSFCLGCATVVIT